MCMSIGYIYTHAALCVDTVSLNVPESFTTIVTDSLLSILLISELMSLERARQNILELLTSGTALTTSISSLHLSCEDDGGTKQFSYPSTLTVLSICS